MSTTSMVTTPRLGRMAIPEGTFGDHVRQRLHDEHVVWLTTVTADGTPQPNPVWFLWDGADAVLVYNDKEARRLQRLLAGPRVSLHFDAGDDGEDVVVITGRAEPAPDAPSPADNAEFLAKYGDAIAAMGYDVARYAERWNVAVRIPVEKVRGL